MVFVPLNFFKLLYWHDVTMYILPKLTLDIYNINGHVQVGWSVRHCPSTYGRKQCSALPTHSSLSSPNRTGSLFSSERSLKPWIRVSNLGKWHSKCQKFKTISQEMQLCLRFCCCAVVAHPFLYREQGFPVSTLLNGKAVLTEPVFCQGFSKVLITNH